MQNTIVENDAKYQQALAIEQAILDLLHSREMLPGDSINIIHAQYEIERKGIDRNDFSTGVVQLLDRGLLDMRGNVFYLTNAGFKALNRDDSGGHV